MPYSIPTFESIRANYLRDIKNLDAQAHTDADSDAFIRGTATASSVHGLYHHQMWIARQVLPSTADEEYIEQHAALRGLTLKEATKADGTITLTPTAEEVPAFGAGVAATYAYTDESGAGKTISLVTTAAWPGGAPPEGGIILAAQAASAGAFPALEDTAVTLQSAPEGVAPEATATVYGGTDAETHAELLARLLFRMQNPPGGGQASDYVLWALEVPGVTWAKSYPLRRGLGTVDLVFLSQNGMPGPQLVEKVQTHIDAKRPVTCPDFLAFAPVLGLVNITARARLDSLYGYTLPTIKPVVQRELESRYFSGLYPGDGFRLSRAISVMVGVKGMEDVNITIPEVNVAGHALTWLCLASLELEPW